MIMNRKKQVIACWLAVLILIVSASCNALIPRQGTPDAVQTSPTPAETGRPAGESRATAEPAATTVGETPPPSGATAQAGEPTETAANAPSEPAGVELPADVLLPAASAQLPDLQAANRYTITVDIDYDQLSYSGSQEVGFTNTEDASLDALYFRLLPNGGRAYGDGSLTVSQAQVDGQPVTIEQSDDGTILVVPLPQPLEPGAQARVSLDFVGTVPKDFGSRGDEGYGIYNFTDGVLSLANWYPILAVYNDEGWNLDPVSGIGDSVFSDIAFYTVNLTVPQDLVLVTTGIPNAQTDEGGVTHYRLTSGPVRDFYMIMSPDFGVVSGTAGETTVNSYYLPGFEAGGEQALAVALDSLEIFNERIGLYPYRELDVVAAPMRYAAGVEYPGLILIGGFLYDNTSDPFFSLTVAHEVAHQWWYNVVGNDVFDSPWLDEGLTTYTSTLYYEFQFGKTAYRNAIETYENGYGLSARATENDAVTDSLEHFETQADPRAYSAVVYFKAALFFANLREEIGDEAFFAGLQDYYATYRYRIAENADLLEAFERAAGQELDDFYREWLE